MGRYKRGSKHHHRGQNRRKYENSGDGDGVGIHIIHRSHSVMMNDSDLILLEKYLLEYRDRAYEAYQSKKKHNICGIWNSRDINRVDVDDTPIVIGKHNFLPLTLENCRRPYLDLPETLSSKERRKVHSMCAYIDLYHDTAGGTSTLNSGTVNDPTDTNCATATPSARRISVSIYEDGLMLVPNRDAAVNESQSLLNCRPWYYRAYASSTTINSNIISEEYDLQYKLRRDEIENEKGRIRQFANLPELTLRLTDNEETTTSCDDLDLNTLDQLDLSSEPTPDETPWMLVDTVDKLKVCVNELMYGLDINGEAPKIHELAFDLEMHNVGKIGGSGTRTCLMQLTSDVATITVEMPSGSSKKVYKDYIIDPLAPGVWEAIPIYLGPIFSDPSIVKIGQGIGGMDTTSLHRDFGILVVNAFDTYEASTVLSQSKRGMGLVSLCHHYGLPNWEHYKELKRTFQCSDWRTRPLETRALEYGRFDIRYLVPLRKLLMRDLVKMDMLVSNGNFRVDSYEEEEDSGIDLASEQETPSDSFDMRVDSTIGSMESSFSEDIVMPSSNHSLEETECDSDKIEESFLRTQHVPSSKSIILASELPCYHHLMKAISISQKRCLKLWSGNEEEPILQNESFVSMIKQAASGKGHGQYWTDEHSKLYRQLAEWRKTVAQREFSSLMDVCTLDFLVYMAYKTPTSRSEMRRYAYVLPKFLENETMPYFRELCDMVISSDAFHNRQSHSMPEPNIVSYSACNLYVNDLRQKRVVKVALVAAAVGVLAIATRARRR
jgi:ribonuclease D